MTYPNGFPNTFPNPDVGGGAYRIGAEMREGDVSLSMNGGQVLVEETYSRQVVSPSKTTSRLTILAALNSAGFLPVPGRNVSPSGLGVAVSTVLTRQRDNPYHWIMVTRYSSKSRDDLGQQQSYDGTPPVEWVPQWQAVVEQRDYFEIKDKRGRPYANGAGQPFHNPPAHKRPILRWDFGQFHPFSESEKTIADRNDSTNNANFTKGGSVWPKHSLLCVIRSITTGFYYGNQLRFVEYSVYYNPDTWVLKYRNVGDKFRLQGKLYPYKFQPPTGMIDSPMERDGPLGLRNVLLDDTPNVTDGSPTGGDVQKNGVPFALPLADANRYYIEFMPHAELNFASFLRTDA
jgi:hypothetical protein